jgi:hypothetical protein
VPATSRNIQCGTAHARYQVPEGLGDVGGVRQDVGTSVVSTLTLELLARRFLGGIQTHPLLTTRYEKESKENLIEPGLSLSLGMCVNPSWTNSSLL